MAWALRVDGGADPAGILFLIDDKDEAESIAHEIRRNGTRVVVRHHPSRGVISGAGAGAAAASERNGAPYSDSNL